MSTTPPPILRRLAERVDRTLEQALDRLLPDITTLHDDLAPVTDELREMVLGGGKRVRPALLLLGHRAAGGEDARVLGPALALELLHTGALLHDDIIDDAATRRGRTTAHVAFAARHAEDDLAGDPSEYGRAVAILLGDLAFVLADALFLEADLPPRLLTDGLARFTRLRTEVMAGQYLDLVAARRRARSRSLVVTVARTKSGRYSVSRPLELGAALAGADPEVLDGLTAFGEPLGLAFQVRDDILGVFGDEAETGKSAASDLIEGKRTLLVVETLQRLPEHTRARFEELLGDPGLTREEAVWLRGQIRASGGLASTRAQVATWADEALEALEALPIPAEIRDHLTAVAHYVTAREQ